MVASIEKELDKRKSGVRKMWKKWSDVVDYKKITKKTVERITETPTPLVLLCGLCADTKKMSKNGSSVSVFPVNNNKTSITR